MGRICVYHRGGGNKKIYTHVDFFRRLNQYGTILKIFKDSFRTGFLAFVFYDNGLSSFILLTEGLKIGDRFFSGFFFQQMYNNGSTFLVKNVGLFTNVHSLELFPLSGAKLCRAAGTNALLISKDIDKVCLKLSSGWQFSVSLNSLCNLGMVSNFLNRFVIVGKAGKTRSFGIKPTVRGVIKNPCDHPHGGGEGRGSPPRAQVSPWGKLTKGTPTKQKKSDKLRRKLFKIF